MRIIGILLLGLFMNICAGDDAPRSYEEAYADALAKIDMPFCITMAGGMYAYMLTQRKEGHQRISRKLQRVEDKADGDALMREIFSTVLNPTDQCPTKDVSNS